MTSDEVCLWELLTFSLFAHLRYNLCNFQSSIMETSENIETGDTDIRNTADFQCEDDLKEDLEKFHRELESTVPKTHVLLRDDALSIFSPEVWSHCFIDSFLRGDCQERVPDGHPTRIPDFLNKGVKENSN